MYKLKADFPGHADEVDFGADKVVDWGTMKNITLLISIDVCQTWIYCPIMQWDRGRGMTPSTVSNTEESEVDQLRIEVSKSREGACLRNEGEVETSYTLDIFQILGNVEDDSWPPRPRGHDTAFAAPAVRDY